MCLALCCLVTFFALPANIYNNRFYFSGSPLLCLTFVSFPKRFVANINLFTLDSFILRFLGTLDLLYLCFFWLNFDLSGHSWGLLRLARYQHNGLRVLLSLHIFLFSRFIGSFLFFDFLCFLKSIVMDLCLLSAILPWISFGNWYFRKNPLQINKIDSLSHPEGVSDILWISTIS